MPDLMTAALSYVARGWWVFPCFERPGRPFERGGEMITPEEKTPYTAHGFMDATNDPDQVRAWWKTWPNAMIGIATEKSGLFVVDIDKKSKIGFEEWEKWHVNDFAALHSWTPSGGMHIVFTGTGPTGSNGKIGIDTRGKGGYIIAPPSEIIEGKYPGSYKYHDDWSRTPGVIPDGLIELIYKDKNRDDSNYSSISTPAQDGAKKELSRATWKFIGSGALEGERNSTLFKALADFCGCGYTQDEAREILLPVAQRIGLPNYEFEKTLAHAYGKQRTPSIPDSLQEKIATSGKNAATAVNREEQILMESMLMASMILDSKLIGPVRDILAVGDLESLKAQVIYKAIIRLEDSGLRVDFITVQDEAKKESAVLDLGEIIKLMEAYPLNTENAVTYANIIKEKASLRKLEALMDNKAKYIGSGKNLASVLSKLEGDISNIAIEGGIRSTNVLSTPQFVDASNEKIMQKSKGQITQLKTGFFQYDEEVGGIFKGELIICAARAGEGKSALALSLANEVGIKQHKRVAYFTLEMSYDETFARLVCQMTGIPFKTVFMGKMDTKQWVLYEEAVEKIREGNIYFDDSVGIGVPELRSKIRKLCADEPLDLIVIDQLEQVWGYDNEREFIRLNRIAYDLKDMAKEFEVPILLNHQLSRSVVSDRTKNKTPDPQLQDLNQAGEKPAHQVWAIVHFRDDNEKIIHSKIKMLKNRNGPKINFPVVFIGEKMLFSNPAHPQDADAFNNRGGHTIDDDDDSQFDDYQNDPNADIPF